MPTTCGESGSDRAPHGTTLLPSVPWRYVREQCTLNATIHIAHALYYIAHYCTKHIGSIG